MADAFLINIGNTNTQSAIYSGKRVKNIKSCLTSEFSEDMIPQGIPVAFASVVPGKNAVLNGRDAFQLTTQTNAGIDLSKVDASTLGADRLANAVALACFEQLPAICIDCGTALTFEAVDENRVFQGGAIAPGRQLLRKALHDYTALLPQVPMFDSIEGLSGNNTVNAIRLGVDAGLIGSVKELIQRFQRDFCGKKLKVVATGGDAKFLADNILEVEFGGFDYTLRGIAKAWELNNIEN